MDPCKFERRVVQDYPTWVHVARSVAVETMGVQSVEDLEMEARDLGQTIYNSAQSGSWRVSVVKPEPKASRTALFQKTCATFAERVGGGLTAPAVAFLAHYLFTHDDDLDLDVLQDMVSELWNENQAFLEDLEWGSDPSLVQCMEEAERN